MIPYTTVIVTYSNRGHLLSSVVSSTVSSGCDHVIIIDNGSDVESKKLINELPALYNLCLLYKYPSPRDRSRSRMASLA